MKITRTRTIVAAALILALAFCAPPALNAKGVKLLQSWKNPDYSGQRPHRVLVIGMTENPEIRADFEDDLSTAITKDGLEVVPGNHILFRPESAELEPDYLRAQIRDFHIDAVLVSRLVHIDKKTTYVPGHNYAIPYPSTTRSTVITERFITRSILPTTCGRTRLFVSKPISMLPLCRTQNSSGLARAIHSIRNQRKK